ncbi:MAG TPA: uroporphyrinogen-III C-methyltransferase [Rhodothermales bacterium]|nr:uroporphyrinogen-III C-methyltransferase [Rhodothermales bacterium]
MHLPQDRQRLKSGPERPTTPGKVYLVGAGPGDPDLITVRGMKLLRTADVVVYDRLIAPALLEEVSPGAELIYVGKAAGFHYREQEQINDILIARASEGRAVVRLKGGDPFVFGRGGEEGITLAEAGIPFEVVPGISSAVAVPAYAGIPVTHRGVSNAFTVVTGHACAQSADDTDWEILARAGTLVILMGLGRLSQISARLIESGKPADTPAAVISAGTTLQQEVIVGTLETIAALTAGVSSPATIVVGEVVRLREQLAWFAPVAEPVAAGSGQAVAA